MPGVLEGAAHGTGYLVGSAVVRPGDDSGGAVPGDRTAPANVPPIRGGHRRPHPLRRYERVNERTGEEVGYADIVKGADIGGGNYVMLDQDELDSVAPGRSRPLDIHASSALMRSTPSTSTRRISSDRVARMLSFQVTPGGSMYSATSGCGAGLWRVAIAYAVMR